MHTTHQDVSLLLTSWTLSVQPPLSLSMETLHLAFGMHSKAPSYLEVPSTCETSPITLHAGQCHAKRMESNLPLTPILRSVWMLTLSLIIARLQRMLQLAVGYRQLTNLSQESTKRMTCPSRNQNKITKLKLYCSNTNQLFNTSFRLPWPKSTQHVRSRCNRILDAFTTDLLATDLLTFLLATDFLACLLGFTKPS